jgi:integrase/recombinase XerD
MSKLIEKMIRAMELKILSKHTQKAYLAAATGLAKHYHKSPEKIAKQMIEDYLLYLKNDKGNASNSCACVLTGLRFFYHNVTGQNTRIDYRARKKVRKLPCVLTQQQACNIICAAKNLKHHLMLMTTYSAGLRASEVIALKPHHIESNKMLINVQGGKGGKDRYSLLSIKLLKELRDYYKTCQPKTYLFPSSDKHKK